MALAKFGSEQVRQLDLTDLALDLGVSHVRVEIMLEARFGKKLHEQLLRQVGVCAARALFDQ
jgi:hypothetical protein